MKRFRALLPLLALSACAAEPEDPRAWLAREQARSAPAPPLSSVPRLPAAFEPPPPASELARDPFGPAPAVLAEADRRPRQALEHYPLDRLVMVGTLGSGTRLEALVKDPDGGIHRIGRGAYLGRDQGRVVAVSERSLALRERVPDGRGGWLERSAGLSMDGP